MFKVFIGNYNARNMFDLDTIQNKTKHTQKSIKQQNLKSTLQQIHHLIEYIYFKTHSKFPLQENFYLERFNVVIYTVILCYQDKLIKIGFHSNLACWYVSLIWASHLQSFVTNSRLDWCHLILDRGAEKLKTWIDVQRDGWTDGRMPSSWFHGMSNYI